MLYDTTLYYTILLYTSIHRYIHAYIPPYDLPPNTPQMVTFAASPPSWRVGPSGTAGSRPLTITIAITINSTITIDIYIYHCN